MTEPAAYWHIPKFESDESFVSFDRSDGHSFEDTSLYTFEDLHPRVKMTQKQYDRLMFDKENTDLSTCLEYFLEHDGVNNFGLPSENLMGLLKQEDIARAWLNPEETIEIVPNMKWFVRSKEKSNGNEFWYLKKTEHFFFHEYIKEISTQFDTKEEAELWTNPLTEAVQLPVEVE